ncbi:unnamed protein product [Dibothriocephalus latus]|uniref:Tctex1 domain-containing protein 2 n=1 Tax=Dibothriocephalus latus TaxID=60516 RepID=A0A3P6P8Z5_DIBLA|nr:unnamed protein product [Dibothriocephalus latus]
MGDKKHDAAHPTADEDHNGYIIRPDTFDRFKPTIAKNLILELLKAKLDGLKYDYELFPGILSLADSIREEMKEKLKLNRYKFIVQVTLGEQKGQGVKASCRCYWDADADNYAEVTYFNERLFCVAVAFGIYNY